MGFRNPISESGALGILVDIDDCTGVSVNLDAGPSFEPVLAVGSWDPERDPPNGPWRKALAAEFGIGLLGHEVNLGTSNTNRLVP